MCKSSRWHVVGLLACFVGSDGWPQDAAKVEANRPQGLALGNQATAESANEEATESLDEASAKRFVPSISSPAELDDDIPLPVSAIVQAGPNGDVEVAPASGDPFFLGFIGGRHYPPAVEVLDPNIGSAIGQMGVDGRPTESIYAYLMFKKRMTSARTEELAGRGIRILGFFPHYAVMAAIPPAEIPYLMAHEAIRWIGLPPRELKCEPNLRAALEEVPATEFSVVVSVMESDICDASTYTLGEAAVRAGPSGPPTALGDESRAKIWSSNGWMHHRLASQGIDIRSFSRRINAFRARGSRAAIEAILDLDFVQYVELERMPEALHDESIAMVNGDYVRAYWDGGKTDAVQLGVIDTGVDSDHAWLDHAQFIGWDESGATGSWDDDDCGHGTHVTGTILGKPENPSSKRGMAPETGTLATDATRVVRWIVTSNGACCNGAASCGTPSSIDEVFADMTGTVSNAPQPDVVNCSWGIVSTNATGTHSNARVIDNQVYFEDQNVVMSAGNKGPSAGEITEEGAAKNAVTVGAVHDYKPNSSTPPGTIASLSSRGPCADGRWKPNLVAPGSYVTSAEAFGSSATLEGTSMAAPHVSGAICQLLDHHNFLLNDPETVLSVLQATAVTKTDLVIGNEESADVADHLNSYGCGRLSAWKANYADWSFSQFSISNISGFESGDIVVPADTERLVVCMSYIELAASGGASKALVNDLDLYIDAPPLTSNGNSGEYTAQQSSVNNTEIRIIENPPVGSWKWKVWPEAVSATAILPVYAAVTYVVIPKTNPTLTLSISASDADGNVYVKSGDSITLDASVAVSEYVGSNVFIETKWTETPPESFAPLMNYVSAKTFLHDGLVTELVDNKHYGRSLTLGEVRSGQPRLAEWQISHNGSSFLKCEVTATADNATSVTKSVDIVVDGGTPDIVQFLGASSHQLATWSKDAAITFTWDAAFDAYSGIAGYSYGLGSTSILPDLILDIGNVTSLGTTLATGEWYINLRSIDKAGNSSNTHASSGPYWIDVSKPGVAGNLVSSTHTLGTWSNQTDVGFSWTLAPDVGSGLSGYSTLMFAFPTLPTTPKTLGAVTTATVSTTTFNGPQYFNLRAWDVAGNASSQYASAGPYYIETEAPLGPTGLDSPSHTLNQWSSNASVTLDWAAASDAISGLAGYDVLINHGATTNPSGALDATAGATGATQSAASSSQAWYGHVRAMDVAGNWGTTQHYGPFFIDTSAPSAPSIVTSPTHTVNEWSNDISVTVVWSPANDSLSGISQYRFLWDHVPTTSSWVLVGGATSGTSHSTDLSNSGTPWYFHVRAVNGAGDLGPVTHFGPILIDTFSPTNPGSLTSPTHIVGGVNSNTSVTVTWTASSGGSSGLAGYDTLWNQSATTTLSGIVDTGSGETSSTTSLAVSNQDWYFHIRAKDGAGNLSATQHLGPFRIGFCNSFAANSTYGVGKPGTGGIPQLVALDDPILGYPSSVQIQNGRPGAFPTLVLGAIPTAIPFDGATLLVYPHVLIVISAPIAANGTLTLTGTLPSDSSLCGATLYHQVLIPDPGATGYYKLAFTPGLARTFGS